MLDYVSRDYGRDKEADYETEDGLSTQAIPPP